MSTPPRVRRIRCRRLAALLAFAPAAAVLVGCGDPAATLRRHTYPPDFRYVTRDELRSSMDQLAAAVWELDRAMQAGAVDRERVVSILTRMEQSAAALGPAEWGSNHPRLATDLGSLREQIARARRAAGREPPNLFWAGQVSGACLTCHGPRG